MRSLVAVAAVVALVAAIGGCGSTISVPDQGVIVLGCHSPSFCFVSSEQCLCNRGTGSGGLCVVGCSDPNDPTCACPVNVPGDMGPPIPVQCVETAQECVGRGPLCATTSHCQQAGTTCSMSAVSTPPQQVAINVDGGTPTLESHCQFADDICCPGPASPSD
jgi:hypothetical protein